MLERTFSPAGLLAMAFGAGFNLLLWLLWALVSFGINARVALAAQDEGKIAFVPDGA
jgi:hypothetical protein